MQNKLKLLITILIVLSGLLVFKSYLPQLVPKASLYKEKIKNLKKETVTNLLISNKSESVKLTKDGEFWKVDGKKADKDKVTDLLKGIIPDEFPQLISSSESRQSEFETTKELGTSVSVNDNLNLIFGKSVTGGGIYVRVDGDKNVFLFKNIYTSSLSPSLTFWADKKIIAVDRTKIIKLEFKQKGKDTILVNKEGKWIIEKTSREPNRDKLDAVLLTLSSFQAESLAENKNARAYPSISQLTLSIEYDGGKEALDFYQGKTDYQVKRDSDKENFIVSNAIASKIIDLAKEL